MTRALPSSQAAFLGRGSSPHSLFPGGQRSHVPKHDGGSLGATESRANFIIMPIQELAPVKDKESRTALTHWPSALLGAGPCHHPAAGAPVSTNSLWTPPWQAHTPTNKTPRAPPDVHFPGSAIRQDDFRVY